MSWDTKTVDAEIEAQLLNIDTLAEKSKMDPAAVGLTKARYLGTILSEQSTKLIGGTVSR